MKIAFFNHSLRLGSGIDTVITELASRLVRYDDVTVFCFKSDYNKKEYNFEIKEIRSVWSATQNRMSILSPFIMDKVAKLIPQLEQYDVVNTHNFPANYIARNLKRPLKIVTDWSVGNAQLWPSSLKQRLYVRWLVYKGNKAAARKADLLIVSSEFIRRWVMKHYSTEPILMNLDGINFDLLDKNRVKPDALFHLYPKADKKKIILFVGRITDHKNVHLLIESFYLVASKSPDVVLLLVGDYNNYEGYFLKLMELVERRKLQDKVFFAGVVAWEHLPLFYSACSVFATCTRWEGFLRAESFAFEKPIVCFDVGPNRETVVDGETGIVVPDMDIKRFAEALSRLLDNENEANRMGKNGYNWAKQNLDFDVITTNFRGLYKTSS